MPAGMVDPKFGYAYFMPPTYAQLDYLLISIGYEHAGVAGFGAEPFHFAKTSDKI